jgi:hypothetical protein
MIALGIDVRCGIEEQWWLHGNTFYGGNLSYDNFTPGFAFAIV